MNPEIRAQFDHFIAGLVERIYPILDYTRSEKITRGMLETALKQAQKKYADAHIEEIMSAVESGLKKITEK